MSKDIIVLAPNGRRQKVHCTPNTSMLQVLENVCEKQGFQSTEYALKHHNHILDLTISLRFSNLPNKATLEMVEADKKREESNVTVGLMLEDGDRRTADFPPSTSLYELVTSLAPVELNTFLHPTILYMRHEVIGASALRDTTLRQLGLIGGRVILRLLNRPEEVIQANVSAVYRRAPAPASLETDDTKERAKSNLTEPTAGPSHAFDPVKFIKEAKHLTPEVPNKEEIAEETSLDTNAEMGDFTNKQTPMEVDQSQALTSKSTTSMISQENLERRLRIEEEVTFLGAQRAVAFTQPENAEEFEDLPDDFYELTVGEVRKMYSDLQQHRLELENTPLLTSSKRDEIQQQTSQQRLSGYKNVVVRIQFPDHVILQGVFSPADTIEDVLKFIKDHLENADKPFHIFSTPLKESLDPKKTLLEAGFVPCVHMHFRWLDGAAGRPYLKDDVYLKQTSSEAASILASKYRAPSRRRPEDKSDSSQASNMASSSNVKSSKVPKWFKN